MISLKKYVKRLFCSHYWYARTSGSAWNGDLEIWYECAKCEKKKEF